MPEEILYFLIRVAILLGIAGFFWIVITQVIIPLIYKRPIFPSINSGHDSVLTDIREWQRKQLEDELADKRNEVELARLEAEIEETRRKVEKEKSRITGDR